MESPQWQLKVMGSTFNGHSSAEFSDKRPSIQHTEQTHTNTDYFAINFWVLQM